MKFKFPNNSYRFAEKQVTQITKDSSFYESMSKSEFNAISEFIKHPSIVLELGCGLGRMSVFLNWMLNNPQIHYILADSTSTEMPDKIRYGWNPKSDFYNDLDQTKEFCTLNGMTNFEIFDLKNKDLNKFKNIDLVMSFLSVGFHYPIEPYLDILKQITTKECTMIFGVRKNQYSIDTFKSMFERVHLIEQFDVDTREDILILENKL